MHKPGRSNKLVPNSAEFQGREFEVIVTCSQATEYDLNLWIYW